MPSFPFISPAACSKDILLLLCLMDSCSSIPAGTHEVQNVSVISPQPGEIRVTGELIDGTTATGVLAVVSNGSENYYHFISCESDKLLIEDSILGVVGGRYITSVFTVMKNGLPFQRVATRPRVVSVKTGMLT